MKRRNSMCMTQLISMSILIVSSSLLLLLSHFAASDILSLIPKVDAFAIRNHLSVPTKKKKISLTPLHHRRRYNSNVQDYNEKFISKATTTTTTSLFLSSSVLLESTTITNNNVTPSSNNDTELFNNNNNKEIMIVSSSSRRILRSNDSVLYDEQYKDGSSSSSSVDEEEEIHSDAVVVEEDEGEISSSIYDDGRHDEIVDSIIDHYCSSRRSNNNNIMNNNNNNNNGNGSFEDCDSDDDGDKEIHRRGNVQLPPGWGKTQLSLMVLTRMLQMNPTQQQQQQLQLQQSQSQQQLHQTSTATATPRIVLFVTPNLILVDQFLNDFDNYPLLSNNIIPHDNRLIVASKSNRTEICTTSSDTISNFLLSKSKSKSKSKSSSDNNIKLLVCTYASLKRVGEALSIINDSIDIDNNNNNNNNNNSTNNNQIRIEFGIFDEAHTMEGIGKQTGYGLDDSNIPISYRFFLTATPRNYIDNPIRVGVFASKQKLDGGRTIIPTSINDNDESQQPARSFLNKHLFGPCIARRTQQQSVEQNVTVPIKLIVMDKNEIEFILQQSTIIENSNNNDNDSTQGQQQQQQQQRIILDTPITTRNTKYDSLVSFAVQAAFHKYNISHAVSFHSNNNRASTFADIYRDVFTNGDVSNNIKNDSNNGNNNISVFNVNGKMSASLREQILNDARNSKKSILTNCKVLSTGVDEPHWNLVVMADPVESYVSSRQMIGRVSRKAPDKEYGYALIPMPVVEGGFDNDDYDDDDETHMNGSYKNFFYSFQAMVGEDPELRQDVLFVINKMSELNRELKGDEFPERILDAFVLPSSWSIDMKSNMMNRAINIYRSQTYWDKMYGLLLAYKAREGNCNAPVLHKEDGKNLGNWLSNQRQNKQKGKLDVSYQRQLEEIGVVWDVLSQQWEAMYTLLVKYKAREGNCNAPYMHKEDEENLGDWLSRQRKVKQKGKLDVSYQRRLEDIGVVWDVLSQQWEDMYTLLVKYKAREGNCNAPNMHKEDEENLGKWLSRQRQNKQKGKLDVSYQRRLEDIGVVWGVLSQQWDGMYTLLVKYKAREGNCNVPVLHKEDEENLGNWLGRQRQNKQKGKLDVSYQRRLEDIGVVWDVYSQQWEAMYTLLVKYKAREGNCNAPGIHKEDGENLGNWLTNQRTNKRRGKLDVSYQRRLEEIGVVFDQISQQWEDMYTLLVKYKIREGNCNAPVLHKEDGENLGKWLSRQRKVKQKGKLDVSYQRRLEEIGVVFDQISQQWEDMYTLLVKYKIREGNCNVPVLHKEDEETLGSWLNRQRTSKRNGKLTDEYKHRLEEIGVVWDVLSQQWDGMYTLLVKYKAREGNCNVPVIHKEDEENLGVWLGRQRTNKNNGILVDIERIRRLEEVGIIWKTR